MIMLFLTFCLSYVVLNYLPNAGLQVLALYDVPSLAIVMGKGVTVYI